MTYQHSLASQITKTASKQTYYTIRFLADRERVDDAFRAYAYFRWVDDTLDANAALTSFPKGSGATRQGTTVEAQQRVAFLERQKSLLEKCYRGEFSLDASVEENILIELIQHDHEKNSGLQIYLRNMMQVMEFDVKRRGQLISQVELNEYTRWLASAVTEAMHYFIGHRAYSPRDETRYLAVSAAHITHMLRDTFDDLQAGYYNIPREILLTNQIQPEDVNNKAYRNWVQSRIILARKYFRAGKEYLSRVEEPRCRLAGFAYTARFEWLLDTIEREDFRLRQEYSERKSFKTGLRMGLEILSSLIDWKSTKPVVSPTWRKP
jgi:phytoene/squalene synthetase